MVEFDTTISSTPAQNRQKRYDLAQADTGPSSVGAAAFPNQSEIDQILSQSWDHYKRTMIGADGRPYGDADRDDIDGDNDRDEFLTFSEGVSYALLRSVWMNDQPTFDKVWQWSSSHMQRKNLGDIYYWNKSKWVSSPKNDHLFAWRYAPTLKGKDGGVIHYDYVAGPNVWRGCLEGAADADLDISAALIFAYQRWGKEAYKNEAQSLLNDVWNLYVKKVAGKPYLFAGDQFVHMGEINPSYLRPAYFSKVFADFDKSHPWTELVNSSYEVIDKTGDITLHDESGKSFRGTVNLIPNWVDIRSDGSFTDSDIFKGQGGHLFGWDAFRTLLAVAEDYAWFGNPQAKRYLTDNTCTPKDIGPYCFLKKQLTSKGKLLSGYTRDGKVAKRTVPQSNDLDQEKYMTYGVYLPFFYYAGDTEAAKKVYERMQSFYDPEGYWGSDPNNYYEQNWAWFGLALINPGTVKPWEAKLGSVPPASPRKEELPEAIASPTQVTSSSLPILVRERVSQPKTVALLSPGFIAKDIFSLGAAACSPAESSNIDGKAKIIKFSAEDARNPSFSVCFPKSVDVSAFRHLRFEIKGKIEMSTLKHEGAAIEETPDWCSPLVRLFDDNDDDFVPSIFQQFEAGDSFNTVTVPLGKTKTIKSIQFYLISSRCSWEIEVKNPRFE